MKAPLYNDILAICQEIADASTADNEALRLASCKKLQVLCATNQGSPKDHPLQWEALADFTEDGDQAMDIYEVALATAEKLTLPTFTASAYLAMALRQVEFEEKEQALVFANKANDAAQTIDSEELKTEITELLTQLAQ
ncbi:hypothetical protein [Colwellia psychrerythraea]|uniref:Replicative DNA helicase n=1 Tax=Colwellia psychrerythraea TaxID=28229 RepID=A0A099K9C7_COLPS|nr:hypothetical protein [Colwellia psychrerythraea]KGJ87349.1 hypothetical protein GAB14E_4504 [Colwellia psychrerythraea]